MERLGIALHLTGHPREAARLIGAAATQREVLGDPHFAEEAVDLAARFAAIQVDLGPEIYEALWETGRYLPWEVAVTEAMTLAGAIRSEERVPSQLIDGLTPREADVLRLVAEGLSDREIADAIFVTRRTASKYVSTVLAKLGVSSRTAAAALALRNHLV